MKYTKIKILTIILIIGSITTYSQPDNPGDPFPVDEEQPIPLDGGISLLAGAGILYGVKTIYKNKKKV